MSFSKRVCCLLILILILMSFSTATTSAQGTVEDVIFRIVAQNLGISAPTKGEVDRGGDFSFPFAYRKRGLDLNGTGGALVCDNRARIMGEDEFIVGWVGYEITVTVQGRNYTFRTDSTGNQVIRCSGGQSVSTNFGAAPSRGATRTGWDVTDLAMRHLSTFLNLDTPINRTVVDEAAAARANGETSDFPYRVSYRWDPVIYTNSAFNCPGTGQTFTNGDAAAYRISITIQGRTYQYRASPDGVVLILCLSGRADPSSTGVVIPASQ